MPRPPHADLSPAARAAAAAACHPCPRRCIALPLALISAFIGGLSTCQRARLLMFSISARRLAAAGRRLSTAAPSPSAVLAQLGIKSECR